MTAPKHINDALETIDAAMFVGDSFYNWDTIAALENYMATWRRELVYNKELMRTEPETYGEEPK